MNIFVDVESSGFCYLRNDLLTWSGVKCDERLNIIDKITVKSMAISPKFWSEDAEKIHGISLLEAQRFTPTDEACEIINSFLPDKCNWIEHSLNGIDHNFTMGLFLKNDRYFDFCSRIIKRESTIKLARAKGFKKNKLNLWADRIGFKLDHHNSESDALCCLEVYKHLTLNNELQIK